MLTAQTKVGKNICLGLDYKKDTLLDLRSKEEFFCPICGERVLLKLGDQRIFHFAHKQGGTCRDFYENESNYHMEGKRQLYQWLIRQKIPAVLEYYDKEIQQRPDIMFMDNGKKYAIEYQCSSISESIFIKRTNSYLQNGYIPIWILSSSQIHYKKKNSVALSNFQYLFLRTNTSGKYYIPSYCPEKHQFHLVESILPYSIKNAFANHSIYPIKKIDLNDLLEPKMTDKISLSSWYREIEKFNLNWTLHPSNQHKSFLHDIYSRNLNIFLLPPEIGLPVPHSLILQTPPIIWQTYFYLDIFTSKNPNDFITLQEINFFLKRRISRQDIVVRNLPQLEQVNPLLAIIDYLLLLEQIGLITRKGETIFQLNRTISIPKSNREKEEAMDLFFQKYQRILSNI
ncbi:competence protein CoiA family protein [Neobacillus drentensis]|uniref:competence protein CoiA n=1 Tax=Neobacillus drentensis TaxID=220684 RepID=UPI002FFFF6A2